MFMLWGGGNPTLTHVDIDKAKNGGYGYLAGFRWSDIIAVPNQIAQINNVSFDISDLALNWKHGTSVKTSGWKLTRLEGDSTKIRVSGNKIALIIVRSNTVNVDATLTFTKNGFSFRAKMNFQYKNNKFYYSIKDTIIKEDNQNLYNELYQNINWIV